MITITVNGEQRSAQLGSTITDLLRNMGLDPSNHRLYLPAAEFAAARADTAAITRFARPSGAAYSLTVLSVLQYAFRALRSVRRMLAAASTRSRRDLVTDAD